MTTLATVATFEYVAEAEAMRLFLEQQGISAYLQDANLVAMDWFLASAIGGIKLQVLRPDVERAFEIVQQQRNRQREADSRDDLPNITFICDECGAELSFKAKRRGKTEDCYKCGCFVDVPE